MIEPGPTFEPTPPSAQPGTRFGRVLLGAGLLGAGSVWLGELAGWWNVSWTVVFPILLIALGAVLVVLSQTGTHTGLVAVGIPLLLISMVGTVAQEAFDTRAGIGDRREAPTLATLKPEYELGIGEFTIDLTGVVFPEGTTTVRATLGIGHLVVTVPTGVRAEIRAEADIGSVKVFGLEESGVQPELSQTRGSGPRLVVVEAEVGLGEVEVK